MKPLITRIILIVVLLGLAARCKQMAVEPEEDLPVLSGANSTFDPVDRMFYVAVTVTLPETGGSLDTVRVEMFLVSADTSADTAAVDTPLVSFSLNDDATEGDILPGDDVYGRSFASTLPSGTVAIARFVYYAQVSGELYSLEDSVDIYLPLLSDPRSEIDIPANELFAAVKVNLAESDPDPDSVWVELYPASTELIDTLGSGGLLLSVTLGDLGAGGDSVGDDGVYSRRFDSPLDSGTVGLMHLLFLVSFDGIPHSTGDTLSLTNRPPEIVNVSSLDSVARPTISDDRAIDSLFVEVYDPDGLADVRSVIFQIEKPDGTLGESFDGSTIFDLYDDGFYGVFEGVVFFDHIENDGIYSGGVSFRINNDLGTYILRLLAKDRSGAESDTAYYSVVLY